MSTPLAIVGHGKMGRLVEQLAPQHGFHVVARFTTANIGALSIDALAGASTAIEFSTPSAAAENLRRLASLGIRTVSGTTGWYDHLPEIRDAFECAGSALLYGPNFSIGVNLFFQIVTRAATLLSRHPEYEAWGWEIHHSAKKDAPSGTLKKLAEEIQAAGYSRPLSLAANRAGSHTGTHEIGFDSNADTITLRHTARSREGYAHGALQAAGWLQQKKGVYEFRDIVSELGAAKSSV
ncbi:MAG TPA: dihydrodipicolinate reductase C-terminal domain-containing protein [Candidatus Limnocylindrales bacterium]|jgi:4-hydroxy-tetrahydrodipicolinate reductase|nr:dihydrodipicolinate reductase C-terminal domain-containing protein [Candidatus Limnocylindrales bacterium]